MKMRSKPPARSSRANRNVNKNRSTKANVKKSENETKTIDMAVLRQPIDTSVVGLRQACKLLETGTPEMIHILNYECDIIYECKVCRNLFRSLANLISHKRIYCTKHYSRSQDLLNTNQQVEDHTVIVETKTPLIDRPSRITARGDLTTIIEKMSASQFYTEAANKVTARNSERKETTLHLQPMENTSFGVFQTVLNSPSKDLMMKQVSDLHSLMSDEEKIPTLGPDGRILPNGVVPVPEVKEKNEIKQDSNSLICSKCNVKFSTRKTLTQHIKNVHELVRICYSCPCCKNLFANSWSVYRHLYKIHRKTNEQVRKLRTQIQKKEVKMEKKPTNSPTKISPAQAEKNRLEQENKAWMEHFESDLELQRCGGCGRRFERKAALMSHSQICLKRITAYNRFQKEPESQTKCQTVSTPPTKPVPKIQSEKKIGIQVRMNYCKTGTRTQSEERRSARIGDESDVEAASVDGKYAPSSHSSLKDSCEVASNSGIDQFLQRNMMEPPKSIDKVKVYLNNVINDKKEGLTMVHNNEFECKPKFGKLEAKCLQLRKVLENDCSVVLKDIKTVCVSPTKKAIKENDHEELTETVVDLTSSEEIQDVLNPQDVADKEEVSEDANKVIPEDIEHTPSEYVPSMKETVLNQVDSSSIYSDNSVEIVYDQMSMLNNESSIAESNDNTSMEVGSTEEEMFTSQSTEELPIDQNEIIQINDETSETSVSSKENHLEPSSPEENHVKEFLAENTISILTRHQLRAIYNDDLKVDMAKTKETQVNTTHTLKFNKEHKKALAIVQKKLVKYMQLNILQCKICLKRYRTITSLRNHVAEHAGWKRFQCLEPDCTYKSFFKKQCISHLLKDHLKPNDKDLVSEMVCEIEPSEWKLDFPRKLKNTLLKNRTLIKKIESKTKRNTIEESANDINNTMKINLNKHLKLSQKSSNEIIFNEPLVKKGKYKDNRQTVILDNSIPFKTTKKIGLESPPNEHIISINSMPNSSPDYLQSQEDNIITDTNDMKMEGESPNKNFSKELVMEVLFGTKPTEASNTLITGRPVRNKMRPKRDSDFIFENHKETEVNNSRHVSARKTSRLPDIRSDAEFQKQCK
uniref:C2H2-type domain-containing protein n=1 Tax=Clastoptera arizonana TaxID=38151 RepID=A0A1B6C4W1_9HEMI